MDAVDCTALVVHPRDNGSAPTICRGGQLIGENIPARPPDPVAIDIYGHESRHRVLVGYDSPGCRQPWRSPSASGAPRGMKMAHRNDRE